MSLVKNLLPGPIDIVGDIHGEYEALESLLSHLGYDKFGDHPDGRILIFIGDFCDRGPNSPAVMSLIRRLVMDHKAMAVLGNHEINILRGDAKDGSGWYFEERYGADRKKYGLFEVIDPLDKPQLIDFLNSLPIALERHDIRIVHAAWINENIDRIRNIQLGRVSNAFFEWDEISRSRAEQHLPEMEKEASAWPHDLKDYLFEPPNFNAHAKYGTALQMGNPIKVLTAGVEKPGRSPFYSSGRWRFAERVQWWNQYYDDVPVVIGHYWRKFQRPRSRELLNLDPDLFENETPESWHGARRNIFCIDYSVGGKFAARNDSNVDGSAFRLAALRWPENTLHFDNGDIVATSNFQYS